MAMSPYTGQEPAQAPVMPSPGVSRPRRSSRAVGSTQRRGAAQPRKKRAGGGGGGSMQVAGGLLPIASMPQAQAPQSSMPSEFDIGTSDVAQAAATGLYPGVGQPGVMNRQKSVRRRV
jgi:hypothetical protein